MPSKKPGSPRLMRKRCRFSIEQKAGPALCQPRFLSNVAGSKASRSGADGVPGLGIVADGDGGVVHGVDPVAAVVRGGVARDDIARGAVDLDAVAAVLGAGVAGDGESVGVVPDHD